jgi:hypothetical protein
MVCIHSSINLYKSLFFSTGHGKAQKIRLEKQLIAGEQMLALSLRIGAAHNKQTSQMNRAKSGLARTKGHQKKQNLLEPPNNKQGVGVYPLYIF